jgi:hypothetical protein
MNPIRFLTTDQMAAELARALWRRPAAPALAADQLREIDAIVKRAMRHSEGMASA